MERMSRSDVLRKCIIVFDAIKRQASKGNAGLEPARGAEEEFKADTEICGILREMLREMESEEYKQEQARKLAEDLKKMPPPEELYTPNVIPIRDWQKDVENGPPERLVF